MDVFFSSIGCKLNQAEVESLARAFTAAGHRIVTSLEEADLHVVNSCTVTHLADRDSRKTARRAGRLGMRAKTVLTGCYATTSAAEAASLGVDLVVSNARKDALVEIVEAAFPEVVRPMGDRVPVSYVPLPLGHSRAAVKVEDGCNMTCSFCIIPRTRGRQRSRPTAAVVREVQALATAGLKEVVVTGVQISSYRDGANRLYELVTELLSKTEIPRFRLSSIAPWQFDRRLLQLWPNPRLCRHFHLSLQSGAVPTLKRMRRPYSSQQYAELVASIRERIPGVAITTDVIVGFPGETDREFAESLDFVDSMRFARVHAFSYSRRPGTRAAGLEGEVTAEVKKSRMQAMLAVADAARRRFWEQQRGLRASALWEDRHGGSWRGTTDNYIRVVCPEGELKQPTALTPVTLGAVTPQGIAAMPA